VTEKATELHKLQQRIPKIQRSLDGADVRVLLLMFVIFSSPGQAKFEEATAAVEKYEREHENLGNISHLHDKKKELNETMRTNRADISKLNVCRDPSASYPLLRICDDGRRTNARSMRMCRTPRLRSRDWKVD
jgi:hypothetical protein